MDSLLLVLRVALSLAAVLGLLWWLGRRMRTSSAGRARRESLTVVGRQQLSRRAGIAVVEAAGRRLVLGYSDQGVTLVHDAGEAPAPSDDRVDLDPHSLSLVADARDASAAPGDPADAVVVDLDPARLMSARTADARRHRTPLDGSILAPDTWRKAVAAVQERTIRRP